MSHSLSKPMGGLPYLNGDERGVDGEGEDWSQRGEQEEGRETGFSI